MEGQPHDSPLNCPLLCNRHEHPRKRSALATRRSLVAGAPSGGGGRAGGGLPFPPSAAGR